MKKIGIAAGVAALAFSTMSAAQPGGPARGDRGGDITRAEAAQRADERFARLDLNKDGRVTREEMQQARQQMRAQRGEQRAEQGGPGGAKRGDRAGPGGEQGFVTQAQFRERALQRFDRMDLNRDGVATAAERRQAHAQLRERFQQRRN